MNVPPRFNVLGVGVHALNLHEAHDIAIAAARSGRRGYVCCCDANSVSCARRDRAHRLRLNRSLLTTPDGMPLVWLGRRAGYRHIGRVYGPDLLLAICATTARANTGLPPLTHFFYGGAPGTAQQLAENLLIRFPGLRIAGTYSPPFRALTAQEEAHLQAKVARVRPDFFWVGLSTPKQEAFMATFGPELDATVMLGVGAAFDFFAGNVPQAPLWMQRSGLEWFFRFCAEPRRLGPRYLRNNPLFIARVAAQLSGWRRYPFETE